MVSGKGTVPIAAGDWLRRCLSFFCKRIESGLSPKGGMVLLTVVIVLLTITLIGGSLVLLFSSLSISSITYADEIKALYLAEAGIAHGIKWLKQEADLKYLDNIIGPVKLGEGVYEVRIDFHESVITSIGKVNRVQKKLQLQYKPL